MRKPKEIFYCNLTVEIITKTKRQNETKILKKVVYKATDDGFYRVQRVLKKYGITDPAKVINVDVIKSLGFENISQGYHTGIQNEEKRNTTTGAYE